MKADLHLHTTSSDGTVSPLDVVLRAAKLGVRLMAVTDHDTVSGVAEAIKAGQENGVTVVPGIEISTFSNCEIHILGYNIDYLNPGFCEELQVIKQYRTDRNLLIEQKLHALGVRPNFDFGAAGVGRMNIARALAADGYSVDINDAFEKYLGTRGKAYSEAKRMTPVGAVQLIKKYGGIAVIAHPKKYLADKRLEPLAAGLKKYGLDGIEVYYPAHNDADVAALLAFTKRFGLLATGGSDYHGENEKTFGFDAGFPLLKALGVVSLY